MKEQKLQNIEGTTFLCPKCGKETITRTGNERKIAAQYICKGCGFIGPN